MKDSLESYFLQHLKAERKRRTKEKKEINPNHHQSHNKSGLKSKSSRYNYSKSALGYHPAQLFDKMTDEREGRQNRRMAKVDSHSHLKNASLAPTVNTIKPRKVKKCTKKAQMTAKRLAASTLEHDEDLDSSLFKSFHKKTPNTKHLEFQDMKPKTRKKTAKMKSNQRNKSRHKPKGKKDITFSQSSKNKKVLISGKPTPEPKNYFIKDKFAFGLKPETKTFDN